MDINKPETTRMKCDHCLPKPIFARVPFDYALMHFDRWSTRRQSFDAFIYAIAIWIAIWLAYLNGYDEFSQFDISFKAFEHPSFLYVLGPLQYASCKFAIRCNPNSSH